MQHASVPVRAWTGWVVVVMEFSRITAVVSIESSDPRIYSLMASCDLSMILKAPEENSSLLNNVCRTAAVG